MRRGRAGPSRTTLTLASAGVVSCYVASTPWPGVQATLYVVVAAACSLAVALAGRRWPGPAWPWWCIGAGLATWLAGFGWVLWRREVTGAMPPVPSLADALHLAGYPLVVVGALALAEYRQSPRDRAALLDTGIVGTALGLAAWLLVAPGLDPGDGLVSEGLTLAYGLADVAVACLAVRWLIQGGARPFAFWAVALSLGLLLVGDALYLVGAYAGRDVLLTGSTVHLAAYLSVGSAALHRSLRRLARPVPTRIRLTVARALLLVGAGLVGPVAGAVQVLSGAPVDVGALVVAWVVLVALAAARLAQLAGRVQLEQARRTADARFRAAFDATLTGMALVGLDGPQRGRLLEVNAALARMVGRPEAQLLGREVDSLFVPGAEAGPMELLLRRGEQRLVVPSERRLVTEGGRELWARVGLAHVGLGAGGGGYAVLHVEDVTEHRVVTEQLAQRALHDPLTGLPTRVVLADRLRAALAAARRDAGPAAVPEGGAHGVAVLVVGLDRFKRVNKSLGHESGDAMLTETARRLRGCVPERNLVARLAGDEFAVLLEDADAEHALAVADAVTAAVCQPARLPSGEARITASVGLALAEPRDEPELLLHHAGAAMQRAKSDGRAQTVRFDDSLRGADDDHLAIEIDLREAVAAEALHLAYQPILDLAAGEVVGHEALLRWARRSGDEVHELLPGAFLGVAEASGLVVSIGGQALAEALRTVHRLAPDDRPYRVSVNVAAPQLVEDGYAAAVLRELDRHGVQPSRLCLEITEHTLIERMDRVVPALQELRHEGISIALDDFGTGFSSLTHLRYFPVDVIKIDRSFVAGITRPGPDARIVAGVVELAHALGLSTTAEGIETAEQLAAVRELGCDAAQGFFLGRPRALDLAVGDARPGAGAGLRGTRLAG